TRTGKTAAGAVTSLLLLLGLYVYRSLEDGRGEAQPALLENLNPGGEFVGPEGIAADGEGRIYVGDIGHVWQLEPGRPPALYADLGSAGDKIYAGGMGFDGEGNLYVCAYGFAGGAILKIRAGTRAVEIFARDVGVANYLVLSGDRKRLWVSDYRK